MTTILVSGVGGPAGSSVAELLLARGIDVVGTDMRAVDFPGRIFYLVPAARHPMFLESIGEVIVREKVNLFVPTVSEELPVVASGWHGIPAVISSAQAVTTADDKYLTACALASAGVPVPRFAIPSQLHSAAELSDKIGWPCISKPRIGRGGREVRICREVDWKELSVLGDRYILQEFAPGIDYAPNVFIHPHGNDLAIVLEKTELKEGMVGNARSVRRVEMPEIAQVAIAAARAIGLVGPQDVDIRLRSDGLPVVLEINARFGANIRFAQEVLDATLKTYGFI